MFSSPHFSTHFPIKAPFPVVTVPDPARPACCLLLTVERFPDYVLYGGPAVGQALLTELTALLRDRLPDVPITPLKDGALLCFWEGGNPHEVQTLGLLLREKQNALSLPPDLPSRLRPPRLRLIAVFSPPLPRSLLLWRALLAKNEQKPLFPDADPLLWLAARSEPQAQAAAKGAKLAETLMEAAGATPAEQTALRQAALWADMGMGCLPVSLLLSPLPLTLAEKEHLRHHVDLSQRLAAAARLTPRRPKINRSPPRAGRRRRLSPRSGRIRIASRGAAAPSHQRLRRSANGFSLAAKSASRRRSFPNQTMGREKIQQQNSSLFLSIAARNLQEKRNTAKFFLTNHCLP